MDEDEYKRRVWAALERGQKAGGWAAPEPKRHRPQRNCNLIATESTEQKQLVRWLKAREKEGKLLFFSVPNGANVSQNNRARLKAEGMRSGVPDLIVITPDHCIGLELKRARPARSVVSPEQRFWLDAMRDMGWVTCVAYGAAEAVAFLEELL